MAGQVSAMAAADATAVELLRSVGQRVTRPRRLVLQTVIAAGRDHVSAEEVHEHVSREDADVHRATVYRTLEGLTAAGVLHHVHLDRGLTAYHLASVGAPVAEFAHLHAQCSQCRRIVDLPPDALGDSAQRIRAATGFELDPAHVALSGLCVECQRRAK